MNGINSELIRMATHASRQRQKQAFVPSDAVAGVGGGGGGGGPPPPGPPPDPSGGGGGGPPPPPPGGGGGGGGMPGGVDLMSALPQMIQQQVQQAMMQGGGGAGGGQAGAGGGMKPAKPSIETIAMDLFQLKKMFLHFCKVQGIELPPDILDGPNRDPSTGMPTPPDPSGGLNGAAGGGAGPQSAIPPIQPMPGAFPTPPGGGGGGGGDAGKTASFSPRVGEEVTGQRVLTKAAAVARLCRQRHREVQVET